MTDQPKLRIAIVGAGIAGLAAAIGLQKHEGIDAQIYERATELREVGASIALGPNGMRKLEKLGVFEALSDDLGFRNPSGHPMIYKHWKTNETISVDSHHGDVDYIHRTSRFFRPRLQQALLAHIDSSTLHLKKTFLAVESDPTTKELLISFADGSTATADILLGADGIHSGVRRYFVPTSAPQWSGLVAFRSVFDPKLVEHIPGVLEETVHWWGPDRTFFAGRLGKDHFSIVGMNYSDPAAPDAPYKDSVWNSEGSLETVKEIYADWHPVIGQLIDAAPYVKEYPNTFADGLESWIHGDGQVTFAGDAAHAHGGAMAAGGSLALDDAYAFTLAIWQVYPSGGQRPSKQEIGRALRIYERTRKAHTDRVLSTVHLHNQKLIERLGITETDEQLRQRMRDRPDPYWIHEHDVEAAFAEALAEEIVESQPTEARL